MICNYFCVRFTALKFKVNKSKNKRSFNSMNVNTCIKEDVGYTANAKTTQQPEKKPENNLFEIFFLVVGMFFSLVCTPHLLLLIKTQTGAMGRLMRFEFL